MRVLSRRLLQGALLTGMITTSLAQTTSHAPNGGQRMPTPVAIMVLSAKAKGVQIYSCSNVGGAWQWQLKAPEAKLMDDSGKVIGEHSAGPTWKLNDGSEVVGKLQTSTPQPGTIPWLMLYTASNNGKGLLAKVLVIRRTNTAGGVAPSTGCDAQHAGLEAKVPYTALYSFYSHN